MSTSSGSTGRGADAARAVVSPIPGAILVPPPVDAWRGAWRSFLRDRGTVRRPIPPDTAQTYLHVTRTANTDTALAGLGAKQVPVLVENLGNVAAYTCVIRALEARPRDPIWEKIPLAEFKQGGQLVMTLQPGERATVLVPFTRTRASGTFVVLVSDPLTDPNELTIADMNHRRVLLVNLV